MKAPYSRTLFELLCEQAANAPELAAVISEGVCLSYAELEVRARRVAQAMRETGVRRGDRVGLLSDNRIEWLEVFFATAALGAIVVPFSTWSTPRELDFLLGDSQLRVLFAIPASASGLLQMILPHCGRAGRTEIWSVSY